MSRHWPANLVAAALALAAVAGCSPAGPPAAPPEQGARPPAPRSGQGTDHSQAKGANTDRGSSGDAPPAGEPTVPPAETIPAFEAVELLPVDESGTDLAFAEFYRRFQDAVAARDVPELLTMVHPQIRTGFGDEGGIAAFRKMWKLDTAPDQSELWAILSDILKLGGTFVDAEHTSFFAPYVFSRFPERLDAFQYVAVTGEDVPVRVEPRPDAGVVERVRYLVVRRIQTDVEPARVEVDGRSYEWVKVGLPSGKVGWVLSRDVWSPVGYRAGFRREDGKWQLDFLVAGD